jgi:hypothetical protein
MNPAISSYLRGIKAGLAERETLAARARKREETWREINAWIDATVAKLKAEAAAQGIVDPPDPSPEVVAKVMHCLDEAIRQRLAETGKRP